MKKNNDLSTQVMKPVIGSRDGAALIIILAFMVMMLVLLMAFFSQSTLQEQVSKSSAGLATADVFARGAAASIIGDLKQEIAAGSTITTVASGTIYTNIYAPYTYSNGVVYTVTAMPAISGFIMTNGLENLLKISAGNTNFFPSNSTIYPNISSHPPANRAATNLTTTPSRNGRYVSQIRWNQPLLIARQNPTDPTDLTPTNSFANAIPQWIYVSRNGANPTTWSTNLKWNQTNGSTVIGRYAYAIYHEGGLLDANVAGYPPSLTNYSGTPSLTNLPGPYVPYKQGTFFADLTQIGLTPTQITNLVGWRNYISGNVSGSYPSYSFTGSGTNYATNVLANTNGFLQTYNDGTSSDRQFTSRQQLIAFLKNADSGGVTNALNSLRYLATFTRSLEQPSLIPPTNRPMIVINPPGTSSNGWNGNGWDPSVYQGGNDNYGNDTNVNPNFLIIRVSNSFTRNDGSTAVVGEPLVKRRFDLRQLSWLTYKGPTATRIYSGSENADMIQMTNCGISINYLTNGSTIISSRGGAANETNNNIYNAFGLTFNTTNGYWRYTATNPAGAILTLSEVATNNREANFFELLKASINAGSIGKSSASWTNGGAVYQHQMDITSDYQILQIGADIMDQNDCDGYPTRIQIATTNPAIPTNDIRGIENLPSLYSLTWSFVIQSQSYPQLTNSVTYSITTNTSTNYLGVVSVTVATNTTCTSTNYYTNSAFTNITNPTLTNWGAPGSIAYYANPNIWNIHDQNDIAQRGTNFALGNPRPSSLAVTITYAPPPSSSNRTTPLISSIISQWVPGCSLLNQAILTNLNTSIGGVTTNITISNNVTQTYFINNINSSTYALTFGDGEGTLYREPTILWRSNLPSGSGLSYFGSNVTTLDQYDLTYHLGFLIATNMPSLIEHTNIWSNQAVTIIGPPKKIITNNYYLISQATRINNLGSNPTGSINGSTNSVNGTATISCQFLNPEFAANSWQTYDQKYWDYILPNASFPILLGTNSSMNGQYPRPVWSDNNGVFTQTTIGFDPRSGRFSIGACPYHSTNFLDQGANGVGHSNNCVYGTMLQNRTNPLFAYSCSNAKLSPGGATIIQNTNYNWNIMFGEASYYNVSTPGIWDYWALNSPFVYYTNANSGSTTYYRQFNADPDGVVRRAMGAYSQFNASGYVTNPTGVATVSATAGTSGNFTNAVPQQSQSRPIVLNRPFRTVDEMGYTFRGTPYKNLDFFLPESGDAGLLDTFCVGYSANASGLSSGKVNLNTLQAPVLAALVSGALSDEFNKTNSLRSNDVATIASALTNRTAGTNPWQGPLANVGDLAGRFIGTNVVSSSLANTPNQTNYYSSMLCSPRVSYANLTTTVTYAGLSADLGSMTNTTNSAILIQRLRQAGLRPFVTQGQTRVWNLMIDLVAQTGRFAPAASNLDQFVVEGESRFWLHVAIDRYTGQILDSQLEPVTQ